MDITVKVVLDEKEYDRLLEIEKKYNELAAHHSHFHHPIKETAESTGAIKRSDVIQGGSGAEKCYCKTAGSSNSLPLSQIIAKNTEAHAVKTPIASVLPSITSNEETPTTAEEPEKNREEKRKKLTFTSLSQDELEELGYPQMIYPWYYIGQP